MSAINTLASLLADLRYLRAKAEEPGCWLLTLPRIRKHAQADAERDALLAQLRGAFRGAVWGMPSERGDEINWRASIEDGLVESYGGWALLLFAQKISEFDPPPHLLQGIKCHELQATLKLTGANVLIASLPDDIEWLIAEQTQE